MDGLLANILHRCRWTFCIQQWWWMDGCALPVPKEVGATARLFLIQSTKPWEAAHFHSDSVILPFVSKSSPFSYIQLNLIRCFHSGFTNNIANNGVRNSCWTSSVLVLHIIPSMFCTKHTFLSSGWHVQTLMCSEYIAVLAFHHVIWSQINHAQHGKWPSQEIKKGTFWQIFFWQKIFQKIPTRPYSIKPKLSLIIFFFKSFSNRKPV